MIAFFNGKGGAGKTSLSTNTAATIAGSLAAARSRKRALLIQLDKQGDAGLDLGYRYQDDDRGKDDDGLSIFNVCIGAGSLNIIRGVRENLDVVPGGNMIENLSSFLKGSDAKKRADARLRFAEAIAAVAHEYEYICIDCPPIDEELQVLGLVAAAWILIPVQFDASSLYGLEGVSDGIEEAEQLNPELDVLGIVMFAFDSRDLRRYTEKGTGEERYRETGQRARVRRKLQQELERLKSKSIVFQTVITNNRNVAEDCRDFGRTAAEVAEAAKHPEWRKLRVKNGLSAFTAEAAMNVAADYEDLASEAISRVKMLEAAKRNASDAQ
ncbi:hypothetical protein BS329_15610 [Amycolatopsis coloradensis]|uniref:AAA domain-containing protein n=1 Tax=Amycolatopsis coloradensis TaxID=76021 RepID=A0A1R0KUB1_9PSEU|nr:hypothetical protein BS329_15610 [Amycolatopsis coloradensis]